MAYREPLSDQPHPRTGCIFRPFSSHSSVLYTVPQRLESKTKAYLYSMRCFSPKARQVNLVDSELVSTW